MSTNFKALRGGAEDQKRYENQDKVYLSKNLAFRKDFVTDIIPGAKQGENRKTYMDSEGVPFVLKITNDFVKKNPLDYKKGSFFLFSDQHSKIKKLGGYYVFVVFKTPSGYDAYKINSKEFIVRESQECKCWSTIQLLAKHKGQILTEGGF